MSRQRILLFLSLCALGAYACGGGSSPNEAAAPSGASSEETCPLVSPGPPPVCPEGCNWNGSECRKGSGIIVFDGKPDASPDEPTQ